MTTEEAAKEQILRFAQSGFVPVPTAHLEVELMEAFAALCVGPEHVKRAGDWLMRAVAYFPKPKDIADAVSAMRAEATAETQPPVWRPAAECVRCGGTSWMQVYELHTYHGTVLNKTVERISQGQYRELSKKVDGRIGAGQVAVEAAARCTACALGRRMRDSDRNPPDDPGPPKAAKKAPANKGAKQMGLNVVPIREMGDSY